MDLTQEITARDDELLDGVSQSDTDFFSLDLETTHNTEKQLLDDLNPPLMPTLLSGRTAEDRSYSTRKEVASITKHEVDLASPSTLPTIADAFDPLAVRPIITVHAQSDKDLNERRISPSTRRYLESLIVKAKD